MLKRILLICIFFLSSPCQAQTDNAILFHPAVPYCKGGNKDLLLDVIEPIHREKKRTALLFVHGGGWVAGGRQDYHFLMKLAAMHGYVAFGADYRLATESIYPAQIEDLKCAVRWIRAHSEEYALDSEKIGAVGASAGAHLVAMLGVTNQDSSYDGNGGYQDYSDEIQAMVLHGGVYDLRPETIVRTIAQDVRGVVFVLLGQEKSKDPQSFIDVSPISHISKNMPPSFFLHGEEDPIVSADQSKEMVQTMKDKGIEAELIVMPQSGHSDFGKDPEAIGARFFGFLENHLRKEK